MKLLISLLFATGDKIWLSILSKRMLKMKLLDTVLNKNAKILDPKSTAKGIFVYNVNNWKDRHSNLDRDNANDQISAIYRE